MHQLQKNTAHPLLVMWLVWLTLPTKTSYAQADTTLLAPQIIKEEMLGLFFGKQIRAFVDKSNQMDLETVKKQPFLPLGKKYEPQYLKLGVTTWYRWIIKSELTQNEELLLGLGNISKLTIYVEYADGRVVIKNSGIHIPDSSRDLSFYNGAVKLFIPKGEPVRLWIKVQAMESGQLIFFRLLKFDKAILDLGHFNFAALLQGALWMM
ncbi:MAG TPA: hypothetical protein DCM08_00260, partial [Microscillaceae bacterium]|nr:hypothetical protein [Microscillaceae bacterium]